MLVVVRQRQVQQAGAGGQVDVLHVVHLRATHRAELTGAREPRLASRRQKRLPMDGDVYIPGFGKQGGSIFLLYEFKYEKNQNKTRATHDGTVFVLIWTLPLLGHRSVGLICCVL